MFPLVTSDPLLILAVVLVAGMGLGWVATRLHLPSVTGQIIAGIAIGPSAGSSQRRAMWSNWENFACGSPATSGRSRITSLGHSRNRMVYPHG